MCIYIKTEYCPVYSSKVDIMGVVKGRKRG